MVMGTASTMAGLCKALGISLPGTAAIPAPDSRRLRLAEGVGRQIVETVRLGITPRSVLTEKAFETLLRLFMAIGGLDERGRSFDRARGSPWNFASARKIRRLQPIHAPTAQPPPLGTIPYGGFI